MAMNIEGDRRRHPRVTLEQPCKVCDHASGRYFAGMTKNLSAHGLLVELPRLTNHQPGDKLHVGVAMKRRQPLLASHEMIEAEVVRAQTTVDDRTLLALKFDSPAMIAVDAAMTPVRMAA